MPKYEGRIPEELLDGKCPVTCLKDTRFYCMVDADKNSCPSTFDCEHGLFKPRLTRLQNAQKAGKACRKHP